MIAALDYINGPAVVVHPGPRHQEVPAPMQLEPYGGSPIVPLSRTSPSPL